MGSILNRLRLKTASTAVNPEPTTTTTAPVAAAEPEIDPTPVVPADSGPMGEGTTEAAEPE